VCKAAPHVLAGAAIIELHEHRVDNEHGVLCPPGLGLRAQHDMFERARAQACKAGIDAGRVLLEDRDVRCGRRRQDGSGALPETMKAVALVGAYRDLSEQFR
jgi:hypothetical protein